MIHVFSEEIRSLIFYIKNELILDNKSELIRTVNLFITTLKSFMRYREKMDKILYIPEDFSEKHNDNLILFYEAFRIIPPKIILEMIPEEKEHLKLSNKTIPLHQINNVMDEIFKNIDDVLIIMIAKIESSDEENFAIYAETAKEFLYYTVFILSGIYN